MDITKDGMTQTKPLISICVCTFRRPELLNKLLGLLYQQDTKGLFQFSIVVVDNDADQSARCVVASWAERSSVPIAYAVEPEQSIALARNACVAMASGELVAFVDDDEEPATDWLLRLYEALNNYGSDGVIGRVIPKFRDDAPRWAVRSKIFERSSFKTGEVVDWTDTATNNALVKREILRELEGPFRPQFGAGGEDRDLFRRAMLRGRVFVWSADAVCDEPVPAERTRVAFQLRRALLRGKIALQGPGGTWRGILKSAIAVPIYVFVLPICLAMGSHVFFTYLVRSFDHLGKLLAACGIDVVGEKYIN
jgi:glycosyltransferase involved in cell wall biosynthesis